jgi:hypothetical protein
VASSWRELTGKTLSDAAPVCVTTAFAHSNCRSAGAVCNVVRAIC